MFGNEFWVELLKYFDKIIGPAIFSTIRMVTATMIIASILGFGLAILLTLYGPQGLRPREKIYKVLDFIVNSIRSFPALILIVAISPITRMVVGTTIGEKAAILPLTLAATPFIARLIEDSFKEVDKQLIEAARSFGASDMQIIFRVMVKEAIPSLISITTLTAITYLAASTMAGAVGAGGLGAVALNYGYQSFNNTILYTSVFILFIMVQIIQGIGTWLYKKIV
ncbi:D-methionine transport system permease protein MetI [Sporomusa silvacetica DSM 10669]|uniref:D-methionine transport system permease protein MetI n=1 Tax=Sporomusa silvacetica DSM 10669 TaxID=1123289 RepID=A0ABZ3ISY2_9FIRM|nr:methionine ABC transporter permease [Sporomusa silvacetica]OZC16571.1 D-methionine transport system permease protein MetI [Sporomusa silvacetica DSM 10669]